jgi:Tol biopolymer transport system component
MPDVQEVFRLATTKVTPDPGALERQLRRQRSVAKARRAKAYVAAAAVAAAVAVAVAAVARDGDDRPTPAGPQSTTPIVVHLDTGAATPLPDVFANGWDWAVSPDGRQLAFTSDRSGSQQIFVANLDGSGLHRVTHDPFGAILPSWSPDGRGLAYTGFGNGTTRQIWVMDLTSDESHRVTSERNDAYGPDWSADGASIVYATTRADGAPPAGVYGYAGLLGLLREVDLRTDATRTLARNPDRLWQPRWSPTDDRVVWSAGIYDSTIWIEGPDGARKRRLVDLENGFASMPAWSPDGSRIVYSMETKAGMGIQLLDMASGVTTPSVPGTRASWIDDHTLLVEP